LADLTEAIPVIVYMKRNVSDSTWHIAHIKDDLHVSSTFEIRTSCIA